MMMSVSTVSKSCFCASSNASMAEDAVCTSQSNLRATARDVILRESGESSTIRTFGLFEFRRLAPPGPTACSRSASPCDQTRAAARDPPSGGARAATFSSTGGTRGDRSGAAARTLPSGGSDGLEPAEPGLPFSAAAPAVPVPKMRQTEFKLSLELSFGILFPATAARLEAACCGEAAISVSGARSRSKSCGGLDVFAARETSTSRSDGASSSRRMREKSRRPRCDRILSNSREDVASASLGEACMPPPQLDRCAA
mmetsp:Transcript_26674/g.89765  ORF Transcript_26674/g.89765 Transcript_26674/m.89765 type:complete len:256 (-) Transcript_26674:1413-2180(-)